jgi:hypothetical protein
MRYALYKIPTGDEKATLVSGSETDSAKEAREARKTSDVDVGIHCDSVHPEELPYGSILWRSVK